uniref:Uncharacterized protein n=1 Tax=Piliocolobus tephrosceles TaxID=591936 RepID=A0A8C9HRL7_9PRIM
MSRPAQCPVISKGPMVTAPAPAVADADQQDPAAPETEEHEERKPSATQQKKNTKLSSKTTAKLSTSAKRIQKELAQITLDPSPNCTFFPLPPGFLLLILCLSPLLLFLPFFPRILQFHIFSSILATCFAPYSSFSPILPLSEIYMLFLLPRGSPC